MRSFSLLLVLSMECCAGAAVAAAEAMAGAGSLSAAAAAPATFREDAGAEVPGKPLLNTDWHDSLIAEFPLREPPAASNLSSCAAICRATPACVAVAWNPLMGQAQCQLKCAVRPADRFYSSNCTGMIVRPNRTSCPLPTYYPKAWEADIAAGSLLLAGPNEPGGHVGNGYVAAYILELPGSSGPTASGVEHIAGVYAGRRLRNPNHTWANHDCDTWCDRAHRMDLASYTSTAKVAKIGGQPATGTASGQDLGRSAYMLVTQGGAVTCVQRTYAHRSQIHLMNTEIECTNAAAAGAVTVELSEPGPSMIPLRPKSKGGPGGFAKAAPMGELDSHPVDSGMAGVTCSRVQARVAEKDNGTRVTVGTCYSSCDGRAFEVPAGLARTVSCISARHSSVDKDAPSTTGVGVDPVELAKQSWKRANASVATLWASHVRAQAELFMPGIEVDGAFSTHQLVHLPNRPSNRGILNIFYWGGGGSCLFQAIWSSLE